MPFTNRRQPPFLGVRSQDFALKLMGRPILEKPEIVERECWGEEQDPDATGSLDKGPRMLLGKPIRTNRRPEIRPLFLSQISFWASLNEGWVLPLPFLGTNKHVLISF